MLFRSAFLFWPRGGPSPTGIGERYSVVTADTARHAAPRSGSVDIAAEQTPLVPEPEQARPTTGGDAPREPLVVDAGDDDGDASDEAAATPPDHREPRRTEPAPAPDDDLRLAPRRQGPWAVQLGAYQHEDNAREYAAGLASRGIEAVVRSASTSSGAIIHRVWVGWFASRQEAAAYAEQERDRLGEAFPVHR